MEHSTSALFITLTFSKENLFYNENGKESVFKPHIQTFMKRVRETTKNKLRFYAVGEYGTEHKRPHYHIILFNYPLHIQHKILNHWQSGFICIYPLELSGIMYVSKYHVNKTNYPEGSNPSFVLMSRKPGIGYQYINTHGEYHQGNPSKGFYTDLSGEVCRLPRFYKDKLYSEFEKTLISQRNGAIASRKSEQTESDYKNLNGSENYFKYLATQKEELIRKFTEKNKRKNIF